MADMASPAPHEPAKPHELHDQDRLPKLPEQRGPYLLYVGLIITALVLGAGLTALGVEIRNGWESHRDWVVPVIAQFAALGGVAIAHQVWKGALTPLMIGFTLLLGVGVLVGSYHWVLAARENPGSEIDILRAAAGTVYGIMLAVLILGSIWNEWREPTRGPEREAAF